MTLSSGHYGNGHAGDITRRRVTGSCASILDDSGIVRGGSSGRKASQVQSRKRSGSSALRMCRFGDTLRFRGTRILMILHGSRTSRSVFGVAPVPAEVRPLRPRTLLLSVRGVVVFHRRLAFVSFPRLVRQAFRKA